MRVILQNLYKLQRMISHVVSSILIAVVRFYQRHISAKKNPSCRFTPTCSAYAIEAITKKGPLKGSLMTLWRIMRCNPFGKGGYDPVK